MIHIENIYFCLAAPLLVSCFCISPKERRHLIFTICGMTACMLCAYINIFFAQICGTTVEIAALEIAPIIEEVMKLLPILFYLFIFEPKNKAIFSSMLMIAIGFATFENICYLMTHGAENLQYLLIRGFGTGAMHIVCGTIIGYGLLFTWKHKWLHIVGTLGVLCIAITYHAQFNLLMSADGLGQLLGACMPMATILVGLIVRKKLINTTL